MTRSWQRRLVMLAFLMPIVLGALAVLATYRVWPDDLKVQNTADVRNYGLALAALVAVWLGVWRLTISSTAQLTERFSKAIDQLGALNAANAPNIEVRLGAIFALERVAIDSQRDLPAIRDVLLAYLRSTSGAPTDREDSASEDVRSPQKRADLHAALRVILRSMHARAGGETLDLSGIHLSSLQLSRVALRNVRFDGSILRGADLRNSDLRGCWLLGVDLTGAILDCADLREASMSGVQLGGASMRETNLSQANLRQSNMAKASLERAVIVEAELDDTNFTGAHMYGARLDRSSLRNTELREANLREASLRKTNFSHSNLYACDLTRADLTGARLQATNLFLTTLTDTIVQPEQLEGAVQSEEELLGWAAQVTHNENPDVQ